MTPEHTPASPFEILSKSDEQRLIRAALKFFDLAREMNIPSARLTVDFRGSPARGTVELSYTLAASLYGEGLVTGQSLNEAAEEFARRHGWSSSHGGCRLLTAD